MNLVFNVQPGVTQLVAPFVSFVMNPLWSFVMKPFVVLCDIVLCDPLQGMDL